MENIREIYVRMGSNLKTLREYYNYTQERLAELLGKSQPTLSKYENGESINFETVVEICKIFEVPISEFIGSDIKIDVDTRLDKKINKCKKVGQELEIIEQKIFSNETFFLYYINTRTRKVSKAVLITNKIEEGCKCVDFIFEDSMNEAEQQLYEGHLVAGIQHYYFYIENAARNEKGMFITYRYPLKDSKKPLGLLGFLISLSHGNVRPCVQKCILSSEEFKTDNVDIEHFLKMESDYECKMNTEYVKYLDPKSDEEVYDKIKSYLKMD